MSKSALEIQKGCMSSSLDQYLELLLSCASVSHLFRVRF